MVAIIILSTLLHAQAEKSAFEQALEQNQQITTEERWVDINGIRYREVRYGGDKFYLQFKGRSEEHAQLDCDLKTPSQPHLAEGGIQVFKRSKIFVQFLRESCEQKYGQNKTEVHIDPRLGFTLPEDPKSTVKNKKIFVSPFKPGVGFSGDF